MELESTRKRRMDAEMAALATRVQLVAEDEEVGLEPTPMLQSVLWDIECDPQFKGVEPNLWVNKFGEDLTIVNTFIKQWTPEFRLQFEDTPKSFAGVLSPKEQLFNCYLDHILRKEAPSVWLVLLFLLRRAPQDLTCFKESHLGIANGTGLTPQTVQTAMKRLREELGLVLLVEKQSWKGLGKSGSSPATYALVPLAKLRTPTNDLLVSWQKKNTSK
jgi:hypothetical protein